MRLAPPKKGVQMETLGFHQFRVIAKSIEVREKKQMKSRKVCTLKENDLVNVTKIWKREKTARIVQPVVGYINWMSGKGEFLLKPLTNSKVDIGKDKSYSPESLGITRSSSRNTSTTVLPGSDLSSRGSSSISLSRSLSKTPEPSHHKRNYSYSENSILLVPNAEQMLVMVDGFYATIFSKAYNGEKEFYQVLIDGQLDPCHMIKEDITFLNDLDESLDNEADHAQSMKRFVRRCTKHNRNSTKIPLTHRRKRLCNHNYRVHFQFDDGKSSMSSLKRAESFTIERPVVNLDDLDSVEIVALLNEMIKRSLYEIPHRSKLTETQLVELKGDVRFQEAFYVLLGH